MEVKLAPLEHTLYSRLYVSGLDLSAAAFNLAIILKKRWHHLPWERRGSIYQQQAAYTTACIVSYARLFNSSFGWPKLPTDLIPFSSDEWLLHKDVIDLRNSVIAHSDSKSYLIRPWRSKRLATDIVTSPVLCISADQGLLLMKMIHKLQASIHVRLKQLVPECEISSCQQG